ncbi:MAG: hypothetical protein IPI44_10490 [Sulfuritalea sp.]|nr:hypothetical protein [Sulfuritalea sp.]
MGEKARAEKFRDAAMGHFPAFVVSTGVEQATRQRAVQRLRSGEPDGIKGGMRLARDARIEGKSGNSCQQLHGAGMTGGEKHVVGGDSRLSPCIAVVPVGFLGQPLAGKSVSFCKTVRPPLPYGLSQHAQALRIAEQAVEPALARDFDKALGIRYAVIFPKQYLDLLRIEFIKMQDIDTTSWRDAIKAVAVSRAPPVRLSAGNAERGRPRASIFWRMASNGVRLSVEPARISSRPSMNKVQPRHSGRSKAMKSLAGIASQPAALASSWNAVVLPAPGSPSRT